MSYQPLNANGQATMDNSSPVVIASNQSAIPITDNSSSITIDGSVGITQGGNTASVDTAGVDNESDTSSRLNTRSYISYFDGTTWDRARGTSTDGLLVNLGANNDVSVTGSVAVTQSGTWDEVGINDSGNSITVDNSGTFPVQVDGSALTSLQLIDDAIATTASAIPTKGIAISGTDGTNARIIKTDTSGELQVDVLTMPTVTVTATNLDVQSGGSDLATSTQASAIQTAVELIDNAISGNEMQVDVVGSLPAGTNAIGKLLPPDIDVTTHTNYAKKYYTNAGAVTDGIIWSPAAGKRWHVTTLYINVSASATVTLEDDKAGGDEVVWKGEIAANSGVVIPFGEKYPLASGEDAADLIITTSAGNVYVLAVGYEV